jgi:hypothetical protein
MVSVPAFVLSLEGLGLYVLLLSVRPSRLNALLGSMSDMRTYRHYPIETSSSRKSAMIRCDI